MKVLRLALMLACVQLLSACVTYTESVFTSDAASPERALELRVELARSYIEQGNWTDAERNLNDAYKIDPRNAEVHEAFAMVYQRTGEFERAEQSYETAIDISPEASRVRNNYAAYLYSQGRYQEAEEQLQIVVEDTLYSGRPRAFTNLGLCRISLSDPVGAEQAFKRALAMNGRNGIALLELSILHYDAEDYASAQHFYDQYRKVVPQQSARGLWLGVRLARATGDRDAESSYALALSNLYPKSPEARALQEQAQ